MSRLGDRFPAADLPHVSLGSSPTPVRQLTGLGVSQEVWLKDEGSFGDGGWGGNKVRKLEWIIPEAHRRRRPTLFTVGGIGTHWGLAAALYGNEHGLHTVLGLVDQPIDEHVRDQTRRLDASGATIYRYSSVTRLKLAAPMILARHQSRGRLPYYLPAGGSSAVGSLGYVEAALEIADQVAAGELPEPATIVTAVGSGGTAAGLALGLRLAGLSTRVFGVVVNDAFRLDAVTLSRLATKTAELLRSRGADIGDVVVTPGDLTATSTWMGETYGASTPEGAAAMALASRVADLDLEPVYTAKALAAVLDDNIPGPILYLNTHGPRAQT